MEHGQSEGLQMGNSGEFKKDVIEVNKYKIDITLDFRKCTLYEMFFKEFFIQNFLHLNTHSRFNDLKVLKRKNFHIFIIFYKCYFNMLYQ